MPSPNKRMCVFGDSHFACIKSAYDQGLVEAEGVDIEFWGNIGKVFRRLTWRNDQVEPMDEFAKNRFAKTNEFGRTALNAGDFDMILFQGCRVDLYRLFPELLHRRRTPEAHLSPAVERRWVHDFLLRLPPYHFARNLAAQQSAQIVLSPISFNTEGIEPEIPSNFASAEDATSTDRADLWAVVADIMKSDGIALLSQPDNTVVAGCCTHPDFAVRNYLERGDKTHKNPAFGALVINAAIKLLHPKTAIKPKPTRKKTVASRPAASRMTTANVQS
jgi:hypothetical protein